jgi:hypothetical protein
MALINYLAWIAISFIIFFFGFQTHLEKWELWLQLEEETEAKIRNMKKSTSKFQSDVVVMLIKDVTAVNYLFLYFKNIFE